MYLRASSPADILFGVVRRCVPVGIECGLNGRHLSLGLAVRFQKLSPFPVGPLCLVLMEKDPSSQLLFWDHDILSQQ